MPKIIVNIRKRSVAPYMDIVSFYVFVSRARGFDGIRIFSQCESSMKKLTKLRHKAELVAWDNGYDGNGFFSPTLCRAALAAAQAADLTRTGLLKASNSRKYGKRMPKHSSSSTSSISSPLAAEVDAGKRRKNADAIVAK
jgi:hypothetical protein